MTERNKIVMLFSVIQKCPKTHKCQKVSNLFRTKHWNVSAQKTGEKVEVIDRASACSPVTIPDHHVLSQYYGLVIIRASFHWAKSWKNWLKNSKKLALLTWQNLDWINDISWEWGFILKRTITKAQIRNETCDTNLCAIAK